MVPQQQPQPPQPPQQQQPPPDPNQPFNDLNTLADVRFLYFYQKKTSPLTWLNSHLLSILTLAHWKTQIYWKTSILTRSLIPMQTRLGLGLIQTYHMPQTV